MGSGRKFMAGRRAAGAGRLGPNPSKRVDTTASVLLYNFIESALLPATGQPAPPLTALLRRLRSCRCRCRRRRCCCGFLNTPHQVAPCRHVFFTGRHSNSDFFHCIILNNNRVARRGEHWRRSGAHTTPLLPVGCHGLPAMLMSAQICTYHSKLLWHASRISHAQVHPSPAAPTPPLVLHSCNPSPTPCSR